MQASYAPLVFATILHEGMGMEVTVFYWHLIDCLSHHGSTHYAYSQTLTWISDLVHFVIFFS